MGRMHSTGRGGGGDGGGVGSHPPQWLHIQRTLHSTDLERVCCCLNEVMRTWGRACVAADRLGACELACSEVRARVIGEGLDCSEAPPPHTPLTPARHPANPNPNPHTRLGIPLTRLTLTPG